MELDSDSELDNVPLAFHDVFRETFMGDDSDDEEFQGFTNDEIQGQGQAAHATPSDEDSDSEFHDKHWSNGDRNTGDYPELAFSGQAGLQMEMPENPTVLDFVSLFITDDMYTTMTEETNR